MLHWTQEVIDPLKPFGFREKLATLSEYETLLLTFDAFLSSLVFRPSAVQGTGLGLGRVRLQKPTLHVHEQLSAFHGLPAVV